MVCILMNEKSLYSTTTSGTWSSLLLKDLHSKKISPKQALVGSKGSSSEADIIDVNFNDSTKTS